MFHIILFYTEGDSGSIDLRNEAFDYTQALKKYFDNVHVYTPASLINEGSKWSDIFIDQRNYMVENISSESFRWNPPWAALNFLLWKPALLFDLLKKVSFVEEGDIVLYHDINFRKYPDYLHGIPQWKSWITKKLKNSDILVFNDNNSPLRCGVKREVLDRYLDGSYLDKPHLWAGAIAFKKNSHSREFVEKWLKLSLDLENRSQLTSSQYPGFIWHSVDQALLAIVYYLDVNNPAITNCFLYNSRRIPPPLISVIKYKLSSISIRKIVRACFSLFRTPSQP